MWFQHMCEEGDMSFMMWFQHMCEGDRVLLSGQVICWILVSSSIIVDFSENAVLFPRIVDK